MGVKEPSRVKLTAKQEGFAQSVVDGMNQSDAYRAHYRTADMIPATIHERSSELAANGKVAGRISELKAATSREIVKARAWDQSRFIDEAEENLNRAREANQLAPANGALALIGKVTGIVAETTTSPDTALDAILKVAAALSEAQLRGLAQGRADTAIEGSFELIPSEDTASVD